MHSACVHMSTSVCIHTPFKQFVEKFLALDKLNLENFNKVETKTGKKKGRKIFL